VKEADTEHVKAIGSHMPKKEETQMTVEEVSAGSVML